MTQDIIDRLSNLENEIANTNSLLREVLTALSRSENLKQTQLVRQNNNNSFQNTMVKPFFKVYLIKDEDDNITTFEVGGKTYDIRGNLRDLGAKEFDNSKKVWVFDYEEDSYNRVLEYLRNLTDEVTIVS